jgi:ribose 5-phosphate isomerase
MTDDAAARLKQEAGEQAAALVDSGMVVGLGTGSTAIFARAASPSGCDPATCGI